MPPVLDDQQGKDGENPVDEAPAGVGIHLGPLKLAATEPGPGARVAKRQARMQNAAAPCPAGRAVSSKTTAISALWRGIGSGVGFMLLHQSRIGRASQDAIAALVVDEARKRFPIAQELSDVTPGCRNPEYFCYYPGS